MLSLVKEQRVLDGKRWMSVPAKYPLKWHHQIVGHIFVTVFENTIDRLFREMAENKAIVLLRIRGIICGGRALRGGWGCAGAIEVRDVIARAHGGQSRQSRFDRVNHEFQDREHRLDRISDRPVGKGGGQVGIRVH